MGGIIGVSYINLVSDFGFPFLLGWLLGWLKSKQILKITYIQNIENKLFISIFEKVLNISDYIYLVRFWEFSENQKCADYVKLGSQSSWILEMKQSETNMYDIHPLLHTKLLSEITELVHD